MCFTKGHFHGTAVILDEWSVWLNPFVFPSLLTDFEEGLSLYSVKTVSISSGRKASLWTILNYMMVGKLLGYITESIIPWYFCCS